MPARSLIRAGHSAKNDAPDSAKQYVALSGAFVDGDAIARASQEAPAKTLLAAIILGSFAIEQAKHKTTGRMV